MSQPLSPPPPSPPLATFAVAVPAGFGTPPLPQPARPGAAPAPRAAAAASAAPRPGTLVSAATAVAAAAANSPGRIATRRPDAGARHPPHGCPHSAPSSPFPAGSPPLSPPPRGGTFSLSVPPCDGGTSGTGRPGCSRPFIAPVVNLSSAVTLGCRGAPPGQKCGCSLTAAHACKEGPAGESAPAGARERGRATAASRESGPTRRRVWMRKKSVGRAGPPPLRGSRLRPD